MRNLGRGYTAVFRRGYWELRKNEEFVANLDENELDYEIEQLEENEERSETAKLEAVG